MSNKPKWLEPNKGAVMLPVRTSDGIWYGFVNGQLTDITKEYEVWIKENLNSLARVKNPE